MIYDHAAASAAHDSRLKTRLPHWVCHFIFRTAFSGPFAWGGLIRS